MSRSTFDTDPTADSYYDRLGVTQTADSATIKRAGQIAFSMHHPDSGGDQSAFLAVKQARNTLLDESLRETYDKFLAKLGVASGTRAFEKWQARGQPKPITWLATDSRHATHPPQQDVHLPSDGASSDATSESSALPAHAADHDSEETEPNPLYSGTVSDTPTIE
jgi:curved DNA-binding protein CbpA